MENDFLKEYEKAKNTLELATNIIILTVLDTIEKQLKESENKESDLKFNIENNVFKNSH